VEQLWSAPARRVWLAEADPAVLEDADLRQPYAALIVATADAPAAARARLAEALVLTGCRHAACWGLDCDDWQAAVDDAYLASRPGQEPDDETMVMSTAHPRELVLDAVWYLLFGTAFGEVRFEDFVVLVTSEEPRVHEQIRATVHRLLSN
jgi:hypothetical protein